MRHVLIHPTARILAILSLAFLALSASAQSAPRYPVAALTGGNVWLYALDGTGLKVSEGGGFHNLLWSPDGAVLAFLGTSSSPDDNFSSIYITDWMGSPPLELIAGVQIEFPISFSPDGNIVYGVTVVPDPTPDDVVQQIDVYSVQPQAGAVPAFLGSFDYAAGCGGGAGFDPSEYHYRIETGRLSPYSVVLTAAPWGVIHSTSCLDNNQFLILETGQQSAYGEFMPQDRSDMFMLGADTFSRIHNGEVVTEYVAKSIVDRLGFAPPGSPDIYYATRTLLGEIDLSEATEQQLADNFFFDRLERFSVSIHRLSRTTGIDTELYTADAYGIGAIYGMADGSGIVFSQIPNPDAWADALASGAITPQQIAAGDYKIDEYSLVELYYLDFDTGEARRFGRDMNNFVLNTVIPSSASPQAVFTPLPTVIAPTATPATFTPGAQAIVNPEIAALNVRATPDVSAAIVEVLPPGAVVTILEGPVDADGYTWWRVRLPSTAEGWVVEHTGELPAILPTS